MSGPPWITETHTGRAGTVDSGTSSVDGGTAGGSCAVDTGKDTCGVCIGQKCRTQVTACSNDADCVALDGCLQKCPTGAAGQSCADTCYTAHPTGAKVSDTIDQCAASDCKAACG